MKVLFKKISKQIGLYYILRRIRFRMISFRYRKNDTYYFNWKHINLLFDTSDNYSKNWFYPRYLDNKIHEPIASNIFKKHISKEDIVLDIGAHVGTFSLKVSKKCKVVYCFEPFIINYVQLINNININKYENIIPFNFAISNKLDITKVNKTNQQQINKTTNLLKRRNLKSLFINIPKIKPTTKTYTNTRSISDTNINYNF